MRNIALYIGSFEEDQKLWHYDDWIEFELISHFLKAFEKDHITLISESESTGIFKVNKEISRLKIDPLPRSGLFIKRYFNRKLFKLVKERNPDITVFWNGVVPQKMAGDPTVFLKIPDTVNQNLFPDKGDGISRFLRDNLSNPLSSPYKGLVFSSVTEKWIEAQFPEKAMELKLMKRGTLEFFQYLEWEEREKVKKQYANEREFILFVGDVVPGNDIVVLLKAFSILKKKMNSSMVLVIAGKIDKNYKKFPELIRTYHYRKDVKILEDLSASEAGRLMGGAYAFVTTTVQASGKSLLPEAIRCLTPAVVVRDGIQAEEGGEAVLTFEKGNFEDLGEQLCRLYKNEELRSQKIKVSDQMKTSFSWEQYRTDLQDALFDKRTGKK